MTHRSGAWGHPPRKPRRDWSWIWPTLIWGLIGGAALIFIDQTLRAVALCAAPC